MNPRHHNNNHRSRNNRSMMTSSFFTSSSSSFHLFPITIQKLILISISVLVIVRLTSIINLFNDGNTTVTTTKSSTILRKNNRSSNKSQQQHVYRGKQYWKDGITQNVETLYETPFARFQIHQIKLSEEKNIDDWLWFDESDNINVLVETLDQGKYLVLEQTKYGIEGLTYAVVGGLIEFQEKPLDAAKRELREELHMTASEWIDLGSYRAAANRGGGITYVYLARKATKNIISTTQQKDGIIAEGELERQDLIELTKSQLIDAVLDGKFKEIKWTATVALALLRTTTSDNNH